MRLSCIIFPPEKKKTITHNIFHFYLKKTHNKFILRREITTFIGAEGEGPWWEEREREKEEEEGFRRGEHVPILEKIKNVKQVRSYLRFFFYFLFFIFIFFFFLFYVMSFSHFFFSCFLIVSLCSSRKNYPEYECLLDENCVFPPFDCSSFHTHPPRKKIPFKK